MMNKTRIGTWIAAIVLGVVGSGVWENVVRPLLSWASEKLLYIGTLGATSYLNSIYVDIARGQYERAALSNYLLTMGFASVSIGGLVTLYFLIRFTRKREINLEQSGPLYRRLERFNSFFSMPIFLFLLTFLFVNFARDTYAVRAANHLVQVQTIVAPYVDERTRLELASRSAQIQNRDDYVKLLNEIDTIATKNKLYTPKFKVF
ncbi:hypothetical protein FHR70_003751 [Microvirga lupini]|uniref:Uncharacterized protein n=1 Tax=Microvirga lupini TaxID=420324 RepID=A0A7W4VNX4_9HYPH|nr:hypothetical protein [Microvirga lupini]MBB3020665.1 hypothetical protein [Microvirga lupini]